MLRLDGLVVFLLAIASISCIQASEAEDQEARQRDRPVLVNKAMIGQHNNTFYANPDGKNVDGSVISQTNQVYPRSDDHRPPNVQSTTVVASSGFQPGQVYVESSGRPTIRKTYQRVQEVNRVANQQPTAEPQMISRSEYNQKFYYMQTQILTLQRNIDDVKRSINIIVQEIGNIKKHYSAY